MYHITKISQYKGKTLRVDFEQGEPAFINADIVSDFRLAGGMTLTEEQWAEVVYACDLRRARERALYLLDYKDYSYILMFRKLSENYPEQICFEVCDKLAELGVINDRRFAERFVQNRRQTVLPSERCVQHSHCSFTVASREIAFYRVIVLRGTERRFF